MIKVKSLGTVRERERERELQFNQISREDQGRVAFINDRKKAEYI